MKKNIFIFAALMTSFSLFARGAKIEGVRFIDKGTLGKVVIQLDQELGGYPELSVKGNYVQVAIPGSYVWPKIEKKFSYENRFDSTIMAYQFNKDRVRVRAVLPESLEGQSNSVSLALKGKNIVINFPKLKTEKVARVGRAPAVVGTAEDVKVVDKYDESYLDKLLKEKQDSIRLKKPESLNKGSVGLLAKTASKSTAKDKKDEVRMALSGTKKSDSNLSLMSYAGKFAGFLALVLLLFYAVVALFKKGAFKKGKLGFLNSTKIVEVLNTTYIGPKRSLLLIRAHNQVFLVGSSEKGLHMISEVNGLSGIFKDGEKEISGSNFDTNLESAEQKNPTFKLKEFLNQASSNDMGADIKEDNLPENFALSAVAKELKAKDNGKSNNNKPAKVKFSQQIKNKVKDLKPLQ